MQSMKQKWTTLQQNGIYFSTFLLRKALVFRSNELAEERRGAERLRAEMLEMAKKNVHLECANVELEKKNELLQLKVASRSISRTL